MKKKQFGVEQIVGVLKQAEVGVPVVELIRKVGISEQTFYRWKAKYRQPFFLVQPADLGTHPHSSPHGSTVRGF